MCGNVVHYLKARIERLCLTGHKEAVNTLDFGLDGQTLCSGSDDANIIIWDTEKGQFKAGVLKLFFIKLPFL